MGILDIFGRRKKSPVPSAPFYDSGGLHFNSLGLYSDTLAMKLSTVNAATNLISNAVAQLPISLYKYRSGKRVELRDHAIHSLINGRVNASMNHFNFMKQIVESVILRGEAFVYILRDEDLNVKALYYIPSENVALIRLNADGIKYQVTGMNTAIESDDMIHLYLHRDENTWRGISVISYAAKSMNASSAAEKHTGDLFGSGLNRSAILKAQATLTREQKLQIKESWQSAFQNSDNGVGVAVLPAGIEYVPIAVSAKDAQLLESREFNVLDLCRFFQISPIKVGDLTNANYSSMESSQRAFLDDTVMPYLSIIKEEFEQKLFKPSERGKIEIEFDYGEMLETNKKEQGEYYRTMLVNGIMSLNEVRARLNLPPIDDAKGGDSHYMQLNMATTESIRTGANLKASDLDNKFKKQDEGKEENNDTKNIKENDEDNQ